MDDQSKEIIDKDMKVLKTLAIQVGNLIEIRKLTDEIKEEKKKLKEHIPMCSWCNNIRDNENYWEKAEEFIEENVGSQITHIIYKKFKGRIGDNIEE